MLHIIAAESEPGKIFLYLEHLCVWMRFNLLCVILFLYTNYGQISHRRLMIFMGIQLLIYQEIY